MKLSFLISSPTIRSGTKKTIKSIVGGLERVDVISRCLLNLSQWKNRLDASLGLVLYLSHPSEQQALFIQIDSFISSFQSELEASKKIVEIFNSLEEYQIHAEKISFNCLIKSIKKTNNLFYLSPEGDNISFLSTYLDSQTDICFILGSQYDLSQNQKNILKDLGTIKISLGRRFYLASHVITIICNSLVNILNTKNRE